MLNKRGVLLAHISEVPLSTPMCFFSILCHFSLSYCIYLFSISWEKEETWLKLLWFLYHPTCKNKRITSVHINSLERLGSDSNDTPISRKNLLCIRWLPCSFLTVLNLISEIYTPGCFQSSIYSKSEFMKLNTTEEKSNSTHDCSHFQVQDHEPQMGP